MAAAQKSAQERGVADRVRFQVVDIRDGLPFDDGEFDVIFCLGLLETLPRAEQNLMELSRVLKPNGTLVLSLYRGWATLGASLSDDWYEQHLSTSGFESLQIVPFRRNQDVVIARRSPLTE